VQGKGEVLGVVMWSVPKLLWAILFNFLYVSVAVKIFFQTYDYPEDVDTTNKHNGNRHKQS